LTQVHGAELSHFRAATSWAASVALLVILLPEAAVPQEVKMCPGLPGQYVILKNQPYALCAGAQSVNFNAITYAKCSILFGNSLSIPQNFPNGNISDVNEGAPRSGGYIVSTYSPPAGAIAGAGSNLAVYTCERGNTAQCDGGICFTSTTGRSSKLWGSVSSNQIICSCPVLSLPIPFEVMGPFPCPSTALEFDQVCGLTGSAINNGATIYIGGPSGGFVKGAACLTGTSPNFNTCTRPER
jgi:hypothetical protein